MTVTPSSPSLPPPPDTQRIAVGLVVAEAMSKSNNSNQKQLMSQKDIDQEMMKQSLSKAIQQIMATTPDPLTALNEVKSLLNEMNDNAAGWGYEIESWIKAQLNTANSYKSPQDVLDDINGATQSISSDENSIADDQSTLAGAIATENACQDRLNAYIRAIQDPKTPWGEKVFYYPFVIAGLAIALAADKTAVWYVQGELESAQDRLKYDHMRLGVAEQKLRSDPAIGTHLSWISGSNNVQQQEASENITSFKATQNAVQGFNKSMEGLIEEFMSAAGVKA